MALSARIEYACIAVLDLARRNAVDQPVRLREIAQRHGIPSGFLVQILQQLKNAGIVRSTRGAAGGYQLTRSPRQITLANVVEAIEGPREPLAGSSSIETPESQVVLDAWQEICKIQGKKLESITFEVLQEHVREEVENMYYI